MSAPDDLDRWLRECGARLGWAAEEIGRIAARVERVWDDERGREWGERAGLVHRQLRRDAVTCAELADRAEQPASQEAGPLLGSTAARRADAARGMRIAMLGDEDRGVGR